MKAEWFYDVIRSWSDDIAWPHSDLSAAGELLCAISQANGGVIPEQKDFDEDMRREFAIRQSEDALQRRATLIAAMLNKMPPPDREVEARPGADPPLAFLETDRPAARININTASAREMATLPGIGRKLSTQIVAHRRSNGPFKHLSELEKLTDAPAETIDGIKGHISFDSVLLPASHPFKKILRRPRFGDYMNIIAGKGEDSCRIIIDELKQILRETRAIPAPRQRHLRSTPADLVMKQRDMRQKAAALNEQKVEDTGSVSVVTGSAYLELVAGLLGSAMRSVEAALMFAKYEPHRRHRINALVDGLVTAHQRGAAVRVLLDKDAENGRLKSRLVNRPAYEALKKAGVNVLFSSTPPRKHAKVVIVDKSHTVTGSHNWTARSIFRSHDISLYLHTQKTAEKLSSLFDEWWRQASNNAG